MDENLRAPMLFDLGPRRDEETPAERSRRKNRERQRTWRERHQFLPPVNVDALRATYTSTERA